MRKLCFLTIENSKTLWLFKKVALILVVNFVVLTFFLLLTQNVLESKTLFYDTSIATFIYSFRNPVLTIIMQAITNITDIEGGIIVCTVAILLLFKNHKQKLLLFFLLVAITGISNILLKMYFHIPRPTIAPLETLHNFSYPSGHAMNNLVAYVLLALFSLQLINNKSLKVAISLITAIWVLLIGLSRVYLGSHFPSDVLAGYLLGSWILLTALLLERLLRLGIKKI